MDFITDITRYIIKNKPGKQELANHKLKLCSKYNLKEVPTDIQILLSAPADQVPFLRRFLLTKPTRALSGVQVVAIMTRPHKCPHGKCITCPGGIDSEFGDVPQSYTGREPATRRAVRNNYDPYLQVINRLEQYVAAGHIPQKIELIIMGGTFMAMDKAYRDSFVMYALKAMNDFGMFFPGGVLDIEKYREFFEMPGRLDDEKREKSIRKKAVGLKGKSTLANEQQRNEAAFCRCVGMTLETRSDHADADEMLRLGTTRVELGVQSVYDDSLVKMERGYGTEQNIKAIRELKDAGFKINAHYMPGLFVDLNRDLQGLKQLFSDPDYRPDMLKIYPCMVVKGTKLFDLWKKGKYSPLSTKQAASLIAEFKQYVPEYCRIMRVQRDIPTYMTEAGVGRTNLRQYVEQEMKKKGIKCRCIRCREIGRAEAEGKLGINIMEYEASHGREFFISADIGDSIAGFCRLRFPSQKVRKEITMKSAIVRELHVYGSAVEIGKKGKVQHSGIGKRLLAKAEQVAAKHGKNKILVISGIGVREYYRKLGYRKGGAYMVRRLRS